mmetsp:Transcript_28104/g.65014  ORF Transcript_28104/g.65014 Transcript_28104/m.65014 type:complete len:107 (-) Transcript_28104:1053-1373(-)
MTSFSGTMQVSQRIELIAHQKKSSVNGFASRASRFPSPKPNNQREPNTNFSRQNERACGVAQAGPDPETTLQRNHVATTAQRNNACSQNGLVYVWTKWTMVWALLT